MDSWKKASEIVATLDLKPHPDGGFYSETFRDPSISLSKSHLPNRYKVDRSVSSAIYFLLPSGGIAHLHRIPCAETWHYYGGEPLTVFELQDDGNVKLTVVGPDLEAGHRPQYTVPPNLWFGAFPTLDLASYTSDGSALSKAPSRDPESHYCFVGVTCAPAFQYEDNELATRDGMISLAPHAEPFINYLIPS
ncbi:RmlC-like jelly roll fold protein [Rhynchospora pubera]|uniref:RmlC-like jelly roll fold protein n=1 Tax=Rhynchospora pubera TaxID=906938 RepID=A0AAV8CFW4_9POAL|nr:RmlC-like jelly roll fold protein [Rhynchospora pubera]